MSDARTVSQLSLALGVSVSAWWFKLMSGGVMHEQETNGVRDGLAGDGIFCSVSGNSVDRGADTMKPETYGLTRHPDAENVIVVNFEHFRTVRAVRGKLYGDRRSPLAGREVKP